MFVSYHRTFTNTDASLFTKLQMRNSCDGMTLYVSRVVLYSISVSFVSFDEGMTASFLKSKLQQECTGIISRSSYSITSLFPRRQHETQQFRECHIQFSMLLESIWRSTPASQTLDIISSIWTQDIYRFDNGLSASIHVGEAVRIIYVPIKLQTLHLRVHKLWYKLWSPQCMTAGENQLRRHFILVTLMSAHYCRCLVKKDENDLLFQPRY